MTVGYALYDANMDGAVNGADLNIVLSNYNQTPIWGMGDFNYDAGQRGGPQHRVVELQPGFSVRSSAAVPEPGTLVLLATGLLSLLHFAWRKRQ